MIRSDFKNEDILNTAINWAKNIPKYKKYLKNKELILQIFANNNPGKINVPIELFSPDFILKKPKIHLGYQVLIPDYDNKIFQFTLEKGYGKYTGRKFGWTGPYIGISQLNIKFAVSTGFQFKIITNNEVRFIEENMMKISLKKGWKVKRSPTGTIIYAIPLNLTNIEYQKKICLLPKITDFSE